MKYIHILLILLSLSGCSSTQTKTTWNGMHFTDVLQTANSAADDPCYEEVNFITRKIIGEKPSRDKVYIWGALWAVGYHFTYDAVHGSKAPKWLKNTFDVLSVGGLAINIGNNYKNGVRIEGKNTSGDDPLRKICHDSIDALGLKR